MKDMMSSFAGKNPDQDDTYDAKMQVLNELRDMAMGMMGDKVKDKLPGMRSVEVSAPDKAGLAKGLDLAKSLAGPGQSPDDVDAASPSSDMGMMGQGMQASPEDSQDMSDDDSDDMSDEEIDSMIQELQAKKAAKMGKQY